nr:hypothetical protein OG409_19890 [Streptomyces sp. NBC_00974]
MRKASRSAALLTLCCTAAAALTGCGGPAREGYVAVGAAAAVPERGAGENVAPKGGVEFQPLPPAGAGASSSSTSTGDPGAQPPGGSAPGGATTTAPGGSGNRPGATPGARPPTTPGTTPGGSTGSSGSTAPGTPSGPATKPGTTAPAPSAPTAAQLSVGAPVRTAAADRWCEQVTVSFANTGGTAARSGTVAFATHIIGALGVDWATITSTQPLPAPIAGNTTRTQTYQVCVEAWRVPLGMRVETQKVTATWN